MDGGIGEIACMNGAEGAAAAVGSMIVTESGSGHLILT